MTWMERIIAAHTAVTNSVRHGGRMKSDRYFVWQEDGANDFILNNRHAERAVTGSTDFFTKQPFDPWCEAFEASLNNTPGVVWYLKSVQYEDNTGYWHHEWIWEVL